MLYGILVGRPNLRKLKKFGFPPPNKLAMAAIGKWIGGRVYDSKLAAQRTARRWEKVGCWFFRVHIYSTELEKKFGRA